MEFALSMRKSSCRTVAAVIAVGILTSAGTAFGRDYDMKYTYEGGIDPHTYITSVAVGSSNTLVTWSALQGPFQIQASTNLGSTNWFNVSPLTNVLSGSWLVTNVGGGLAVFRIASPALQYRGVSAGGCAYCHMSIAARWGQTPHADALESLEAIGQDTNTSCLACHTTGYGYPTGYPTNAANLGGVQCENCHGPAGSHAGKQFTPAKTQSPYLCGGCHEETYAEWSKVQTNATGGLKYYHGRTRTNMHYYTSWISTNTYTREERMGQCGPCHAGRVQYELANTPAFQAPTNAYLFPTSNQVIEAGIGCVTCHDPHDAHPEHGGSHLRYPLYSTNAAPGFFYMQFTNTFRPLWGAPGGAFGYSQATNFFLAYTNFHSQYNPDLMLCSQCHRERIVDSSQRLIVAPHVSHQYGINSATIGVTIDTNVVPRPAPGAGSSMQHGINTNGATCTLCHVPHEFHVEFNEETCYRGGCHPTNDVMEDKIATTEAAVSNSLLVVRDMLNAWATNYADGLGITNCHFPGGVAPNTNRTIKWEYTPRTAGGQAGALSTWGKPSGQTNVGVSAGQQTNIPPAIREARYNLYLVVNDLSWGVHNPAWTKYLIDVASNKVATWTPPSPAPKRTQETSSSPTKTSGTSLLRLR